MKWSSIPFNISHTSYDCAPDTTISCNDFLSANNKWKNTDGGYWSTHAAANARLGYYYTNTTETVPRPWSFNALSKVERDMFMEYISI